MNGRRAINVVCSKKNHKTEQEEQEIFGEGTKLILVIYQYCMNIQNSLCIAKTAHWACRRVKRSDLKMPVYIIVVV